MYSYLMSTTHKVRKALVMGGGIAGPVAALALRKAGIDAVVYEAYAGTSEGVGGMLMVAPNGLAALRVVDVDVSHIGQPIAKMRMTDGVGKVLAELPGLPDLPPSRVLWRSDLYRAIAERAVAARIRVEHGKRLVGVEETERGVGVLFADGSTAEGDIVIGADGIGSRVRSLIDPLAPGPEYVGFLGIGGCSSASDLRGSTDTMCFAFGKRAFLGHWTQPDGVIAWFSNVPYERALTTAEARAIPKEEWHARLRELHADDVPGGPLIATTRTEDLLIFGAGEILPSVPLWHRGRMVLVGDAAHAPSSSSGQGASLAAESAIELARCLRDHADHEAAFTSYEQLRRPRVERVAAFAAKQNNHKVAGPITKALMSVLMPIATRTFMTPKRMFGWMHEHRIEWDQRASAG
jgi:2-polyprenyl-6-methoxyphenol hydroxylase-like FAD-dependent oxidoreductase